MNMPNIASLEAGAYWYTEAGKGPVICEKRSGEAFIRFTNGGRQSWCREGDRFDGPLPSPEAPAAGLAVAPTVDFQERTSTWAVACFGEAVASDRTERAQRFVEESLELAQASGIPREDVLQLVDYVFGRPVGRFEQEVGGVLTTLALLCAAWQASMSACGEAELARVWSKIEAIRAKQAAKPSGSPLPIAMPPPRRNAGGGCALSTAQVNHLRRLLGWIRCEVGQQPEALVNTVRSILPALGEPQSHEARHRLVLAHEAATKVPKYVWAGIKALSRATGEHLDLEDSDRWALSDEAVAKFWEVFKNDRALMSEFEAFAGTARDIYDAGGMA